MYNAYNEKICKLCSFKGRVSEPVKIMDTELIYVNCLRDNEGTKEAFIRTNRDENLSWIRQGVELQHCIFAYKDGFLHEQLL